MNKAPLFMTNEAPVAVQKKRHKGTRPKHVPIRTCVVCREQSTKRALVRIVRQPDGEVVIDPTGKLNGRGTYLCDKPACRKTAAETEVLAKALNTTIGTALRDDLRRMAAESDEQSDPAASTQ